MPLSTCGSSDFRKSPDRFLDCVGDADIHARFRIGQRDLCFQLACQTLVDADAQPFLPRSKLFDCRRRQPFFPFRYGLERDVRDQAASLAVAFSHLAAADERLNCPMRNASMMYPPGTTSWIEQNDPVLFPISL